jgi:threonine aldolase
MIFASDNWAGASEEVMEALSEAARKGGPAYGADRLTTAVEARFAEIFEREVAVFLVASGTVANALALSAFARPGGFILAHRDAHILVDEAGAVEFFSGGNRVVGLDAAAGKIAPETLLQALQDSPERAVHHGQPVAVSLTQITEFGAAYRPDEIAALADAARTRGLAVHMDGARFAGAVAALGLPPADLTWRAGIDVLSFGGTKNGCLAAEAVIFFDPGRARDFVFARQRAGQGYSKNWFLAAQFVAYLENDRWLDLARRANSMARLLADGITKSSEARLALQPDANEIFAIMPKAAEARLRAAGAAFYPWKADRFPERPGKDESLVRLVTSFQTTEAEVARFVSLLDEGKVLSTRFS